MVTRSLDAGEPEASLSELVLFVGAEMALARWITLMPSLLPLACMGIFRGDLAFAVVQYSARPPVLTMGNLPHTVGHHFCLLAVQPMDIPCNGRFDQSPFGMCLLCHC